jgi:hypothetical protein
MKTLLITISAMLVLFFGCSNDECVQCPPVVPVPTIDNIWPNADKMAWTYAYEQREWGGEATIYPTRDDIPDVPLPKWSEIFDLVEEHAPKEPFTTVSSEYRLRFDGLTTTESGVTAQNLVMEFLTTGAEDTKTVSRTFDLKQVIAARQVSLNRVPPDFDQVPSWPHLIHGGAWEKTPQWIGTYGDLSEELAWKFLASDLSPGSEFSFPLTSTLTEGPVLHGRVHREVTVETKVGTFARALDCLYIVDLGILTVLDLEGGVAGYIRQFEYGRVIYAPTIGPVYGYERWGVEPGSPPSDGFSDITLSLVGLSNAGN